MMRHGAWTAWTSSRSIVHELAWPVLLLAPCPSFPVPEPRHIVMGSVVTKWPFLVFVSEAMKTWFMEVLLVLLSLVQRAVSVARRVKRSSLARPGAVHLVGLGGSSHAGISGPC